MTDIRDTSTDGIRAQFARNAKLPEDRIADAERFLDTLNKSMASGGTPSAETLQDGRSLLRSLEDRTELFAFNATVLAAQESNGAQELDAKMKTITAGVEQAERTTARLRSTLDAFGR